MLNLIIENLRILETIEGKEHAANEAQRSREEIEELLNIAAHTCATKTTNIEAIKSELRIALTQLSKLDTIDEFLLLSQANYLDRYILQGHTEASRELFSSVFYFMDAESRADWLMSNIVANDDVVYANRWAEFIIVTNRRLH